MKTHISVPVIHRFYFCIIMPYICVSIFFCSESSEVLLFCLKCTTYIIKCTMYYHWRKYKMAMSRLLVLWVVATCVFVTALPASVVDSPSLEIFKTSIREHFKSDHHTKKKKKKKTQLVRNTIHGQVGVMCLLDYWMPFADYTRQDKTRQDKTRQD